MAYLWYEKNPQLLEDEKRAMRMYFPQFSMVRLANGKLAWEGEVTPEILGRNVWYLQIVYDHNHPHNNTFGGSLRVYSILPDLNELEREYGPLPHTLHDSSDNIYICTSRPSDFKTGSVQTTAASAVGWALKWIAALELWLNGDLTRSQFSGHAI